LQNLSQMAKIVLYDPGLTLQESGPPGAGLDTPGFGLRLE